MGVGMDGSGRLRSEGNIIEVSRLAGHLFV
jgi:hypothetical protein